MQILPAIFVRTSFFFLVAGFFLGGWMMVSGAYGLPMHYGVRMVHIHFLTVGFFTLIVMGVALWMFPAPPGSTARFEMQKRAPWGWAAYVLVVAGLLLRAVMEFAPHGAGRLLVLLSALGQVAGATCFLVAIWDRDSAPLGAAAACQAEVEELGDAYS